MTTSDEPRPPRLEPEYTYVAPISGGTGGYADRLRVDRDAQLGRGARGCAHGRNAGGGCGAAGGTWGLAGGTGDLDGAAPGDDAANRTPVARKIAAR